MTSAEQAILIVDNDDSTRELYQRALSQSYQVYTASDEQNILDIVHQHAIQAVVAGQGIAICSDILVAREMMDGSLVRAYDVSLPGFGFYLTSVADSPRRGDVGLFGAWAASVI